MYVHLRATKANTDDPDIAAFAQLLGEASPVSRELSAGELDELLFTVLWARRGPHRAARLSAEHGYGAALRDGS